MFLEKTGKRVISKGTYRIWPDWGLSNKLYQNKLKTSKTTSTSTSNPKNGDL